ncbi:MAG: nucleotidyltransferase family protein [Phycisphaeraceae bacterium]
MSNARLQSVCVPAACPLHEAMRAMDAAGLGIFLVLDNERRLVGIVTDGDLRRAMLARQNTDITAGAFVEAKRNPVYPKPVTGRISDDTQSHLKLMRQRKLHHLPLLDSEDRVADLIVMDDLLPKQSPPMRAVIMAGGLGTRLRPLTENTPKPMLPVGDRPLMERTLESLRGAGIRHVSLSTGYQADKVAEHFKDGRAFGVDLDYVTEDRPMGTAGALSLMAKPSEPLLVINGDILTNVDYSAMLAFHQEQEALLTVAVRKFEFNVPYGVIECDGSRVNGLTEKPTYTSFVNAGIYLLDPGAFDYIPRPMPEGTRFNMTDLIQKLIDAKLTVAGFPIREYWLDIGQPADYEQAQADVRDGRYAQVA